MIDVEEIQAIKKTSLGLELEILYFLTRPGDYVVDVGAAYGCLTPWLAKWCGPDGLIEAIEPDLERMKELQAVMASAGFLNRTRCHTVAVSKENKQGILYCRADGVAYDNKINNLGLPHHGEERPIEIKRLDSILTHVPDVMKIDAEGAEELVLEGMGEFLQSDKLKLVFEYAPAAGQYYIDLGHPSSLLNTLREKGFQLWVISKCQSRLYYLPPEQDQAFTDTTKKQWGGVENLVAMSLENFNTYLQPVIDQKLIQVRNWNPTTFVKEQIGVNYGGKR